MLFDALRELGQDMGGNQKATTIILVSLMICGYFSFDTYLSHKSKEIQKSSASSDLFKTLEAFQFESEQNTKRQELWHKTLRENSIGSSIEPQAIDLYEEKIKVFSKADKVLINSHTIPKEVSKILQKSPKVEKRGQKLDTNFKIL